MDLPLALSQIHLSLREPSAYALIAIGFLVVALGMALDEWRRDDNRECRRLAAAFGLVLALRLLDLVVRAGASAPYLTPLVDSASLVLILWAFTRPLFDNPEQADAIGKGLFALALAGAAFTWIAWLLGAAGPRAGMEHWSALIWRLAQVGLAGLGIWAVLARRSEQRAVLAVAFGLVALSNAAGLFGYAAWIAPANALVYPLFAVATYQMITADLRAFGQELRSISERSLQHMTEQIFLMEMSRAATESLDQANILRVVTESSGLAFNADRVVLLLDDSGKEAGKETGKEAGRLGVAARYYPLTDGVAEGLQSHVYLRDALLLKGVVRRQKQLILNGASGVGARPAVAVLEHLLGIEPLEHAIIEPLAFKGQVLGLIIAARLQGRPAFSNDEGRLLSSLGALITSALQNARLYHELKEANDLLSRLNADVRAAYEQLRALDQLKSSFIGLITHELRSPFVDLDLSLQLLRRYGTTDWSQEQQEQLQQLEAGVGRARRMVDALVSFASLLSKQSALRFEELAFSETVEGVVRSLTPLAESRDVQIVVAAGDGPAVVAADKERLAEAVHHLVHNAIKFNRAGGRVDIRYWADGARLACEVEDTGVGLEPAQLERIWQQFSQTADPFRRGVEGLGLGLALVKLIVEAHGGQVAAQSSAGVGSVFGFQIPVRPPAVAGGG